MVEEHRALPPMQALNKALQERPTLLFLISWKITAMSDEALRWGTTTKLENYSQKAIYISQLPVVQAVSFTRAADCACLPRNTALSAESLHKPLK